MTTPDLDQVLHALNESQTRVARYARLVGNIRYQQSSNHVTDAAMRAETGRLLDEFFGTGLSAAGGTAGVQRSPAGSAVSQLPSPARPVVASSPPMGDRPGTPHGRGCIDTCCLPDTWAMGTADYASAKRVTWL